MTRRQRMLAETAALLTILVTVYVWLFWIIEPMVTR